MGASGIKGGAFKTCMLVALASFARLVLQYENAADIKFLLNFSGTMFDTLELISPTPNDIRIAPCEELHLIQGSRVPMLFKGCIQEKYSIEDLTYFGRNAQNLFPKCKSKLTQEFEYTDMRGTTTPIVENNPCMGSTLQEKILRFNNHQLGKKETFTDVHTYMLSNAEFNAVSKDLTRKSVFPDTFDLRAMGVCYILNYFLNAGTTAAYYFHAHLDHFLSFNVAESKEWELIAPQHFDKFERVWSGKAMMLTRELAPAPRVRVRQDRGDILFLPPWWIHKTLIRSDRKNLGVNIHWLAKGQFVGHACEWARQAGWTTWFMERHR